MSRRHLSHSATRTTSAGEVGLGSVSPFSSPGVTVPLLGKVGLSSVSSTHSPEALDALGKGQTLSALFSQPVPASGAAPTRKAWLALSLMEASSGLSTGVWRVKRVSNWLTSSSDCCGGGEGREEGQWQIGGWPGTSTSQKPCPPLPGSPPWTFVPCTASPDSWIPSPILASP